LLMEDGEWTFFEPFLVGIRGRGARPASNHRLILDGIFWIARTGSAWRDLPEEFGKWSSVYRQFRRWTLAGLWEMVLETLNESGVSPGQVHMIDSTVIRAHHLAAGARAVPTFLESKRWEKLALIHKVRATFSRPNGREAL
jgi:transposase